MSTATVDLLTVRNPSSGAVLGRVVRTPPEALAELIARARAAQRRWGETAWKDRRAVIRRLWRLMAAEANDWARAIEAEVGKPRGEALAGDVVATLDALRWTVQEGGRVLADRRLAPGWQRWILIPPAELRLRPMGVIGMIGTWNYPLLLNAPPIVQALAAGNAVVWKPSELAMLAGQRLQDCADRVGVPEGLLSTVYGGPELGAALARAAIDKGVFTGGIAGGRKVLESLAQRGVPAVAEFSGYDPAIILDDAPREATIRALLWGAFVGSGQTCVSVKRIYIVGDALPWAEALAAAARRLRLGDPAAGPVDLGPLISESARNRFDQTIQATIAAGARSLAGAAARPGSGWFYEPTVLLADTDAPEKVMAGAFGPVALVRGVPSVDAAVAAANASDFGLAASVWGGNVRTARAVARRLEAGMVAVNEAVTPSAHAAAPFGGIKASGFGRTRGAMGLAEFTQPQTLHVRQAGGFRPQLYPYEGRLQRLLNLYLRVFHPRA